MFRRAFSLALVVVLLIGIGPTAVRSGGQDSGPFAVPDGVLALPSLEQRCLEALRTPGQSGEWYADWLQRLCRCAESPAAVAELVRYLEFSPDWLIPGMKGGTWIPPHCPAKDALVELGPMAAPPLVDDYIFFYENYDLRSWKGRAAALGALRLNPETWVPDPEQSPAFRLWRIENILAERQATAREAVNIAFQRMAAEPQDDCVQRACRELIDQVVSRYPEDEWAKLFPAAFAR
jgi:hypothetical protein